MAEKDKRLFIKVTLDFADNEKIAPLSDAAFRALIEMMIWCRQREGSGWIARRLALAKWSLEVLHELSTNHDEFPSLIESEDGWQIHDYGEIQETGADIEARRERNRIAGQKGGLAKGKRTAKQGAKRTAKRKPSENLAEIEIDNSLTPNGVRESPRKRGTRLTPDWIPPQTVIDSMKAECPHVDLQAEHRKFIDHFTGNGKTMIEWPAAWRNWIRRAAEHRPRNGDKPRISASDAAFAAAQALKTTPANRLELA